MNTDFMECVSFSWSLMHHSLSWSLKIRPNCGLEVESLLQPTAGAALLHLHRTQTGDDVAEAKDPTAPPAEAWAHPLQGML